MHMYIYEPVMIAVRLVASIPRVTSSAVEAEPNPLGPLLPVISEYNPIVIRLTFLFYGFKRCSPQEPMWKRERETKEEEERFRRIKWYYERIIFISGKESLMHFFGTF